VDEKSSENKQTETDKVAELKDEIVTTTHEIIIQGQPLHYTATTGIMVMKDEEGKAKAKIFFIAYTKEGAEAQRRPLTISFNGGPGSSSVWLHLGVLGPKRVLSGDVDHIEPPPYRLQDNEYTLLQSSDLLFVDPVSTGYSRPAPGEEARQFHGLEKDIESVGDFIRLYITRYKRWNSPKFLIGESYGTTRAAGLAGYLQDRHGMYLNGLMLVSVILNFQTARFDTGNDLPFILFLPTYAATAYYHNKAMVGNDTPDLKSFLAEVERFAAHEYTLALMKGNQLAEAERRQIIQHLVAYTGLSADYLQQTNLRIYIHRFVKELLRENRRTVGRLDTRFKGLDRDAAGESFEHDPSYSAIQGAYTATLNDYVRRDLAFESDIAYEILTGLYEKWDYNKHQNQYVNVAETLRSAMSKNPFLQVLVANGYYDLATPYFATEYTMNHLELDPALQHNITLTYYEGGHMMYVHEPSLAQLSEDLLAFVAKSIRATHPAE
jgi:carboxypeptidase C (cathepsin A)